MIKALCRIGAVLFIGIASFAWCAGTAHAAGGITGTLRGQVVDFNTHAPLAGVSVVAVSTSGSYHATTDTNGYFTLLELPTDTYALSITKHGYTSIVISGVTVLGDQTQNVGIVRLPAAVKTLGTVRATARSSSAFQPTQTVDETTFVGDRVDQALGEKGSTNFSQLVLSAPGVIPTAAGSLNPFSIRGSASVEIGYQFDGVDYRGEFFDENPSQNYLNGVGGGHGGLQVVSGAGDATQGGIGAGVVNVIPGRGSYPGDGFISFDVSSPWYDHALAFQYGTATPDGRFSDFISTRSDRSAPEIAPYGRDASDAGQYQGTSFTYDDDVLNNFFYRFGKQNDQSVQVLADFLDHRSWAEYGGLAGAAWYPDNPYSYDQFQTDYNGAAMWPCTGLCGLRWYQSVIAYQPGVPHPNALGEEPPVAQPEEYLYGPTDFLKLGYTRALSPTTALNTFFYNWGGLVASNITGNSSDLTDGSNLDGYNNSGGRRVGVQTEITHQAGEKHTLSLVGKFENGFPYWTQQNDGNTWQGFDVGRAQDEADFPNYVAGEPPPAINEPRVEDWFLPEDPNGTPVGASNPCIGPAMDNGFTPGAPTQMGCYLYSQLVAMGKWNGHLPIVPTTGWDYGDTDFQQFGVGFRDQWTPNDKLHVDWGLRVDGQNLKWAANPFSKDLSDTADVGLGYASLSSSYLNPRVLEPRIAIDDVLNPNNSLRMSFGRSVSFQFAQTAGTPSAMAYINPILFQIPAKDSAAIDPAENQYGPACGSGWHGPGTNGNGTYLQNPYVYFSGESVLNEPGWYFKCPNYAESIYWMFDQGYSAPDIGGSFPPTYNNWDIAWEHQFHNGWGSKYTAYWRRGWDTYQTTLLNAGPPDPVTGQETAGSFQERETGNQQAFGLEFMLTTPDREDGWSGFFSANYVNELTNTPPVAGSDSLPIVQQYLYQTGTLFHQSYLPPLSATAGLEYKAKNGLRINPIFNADGGEPFGVGLDAIGYVNGVLYHLPTCNLGVCTPYAGPGLPNQAYNATCYDDPAFPGNYFDPNYFACRGYAEPALAGQKYTRPRIYSDLDIEYTHNNVTYGAYITNLFNNYRSEPQVNQDWQPVSTGVGGAQTGEFAGAYPVNLDGTPNPLYAEGARDESGYDQSWLPFQEFYEAGTTLRAYVQFKF
jgi:hypothetical protein